MKIIYSDTRSIIINQNKVYKFFNTEHECKNEIQRLVKFSIPEIHDKISDYKMKMVKIIEINKFFYSMNRVNGVKLSLKSNKRDFYLAGRWLRSFHNLSFDSNNNKVNLFGDYVSSHLYLDHKNKTISALDPGKNFGNIDEIEIDISRFIVSLLYSKNFNLSKLIKIIFFFLEGYGLEKVYFLKLNKFIKYRIFRNFKKTYKLKKGIKYFTISLIYLIIANFKYFFVQIKLNNFFVKLLRK